MDEDEAEDTFDENPCRLQNLNIDSELMLQVSLCSSFINTCQLPFVYICLYSDY